MITRGGLVWLCLAVIAAVFAFIVSNQVRDAREELAGLTQQLEETQENVQLLRAEWNYLRSPPRLNELADVLLDTVEMNPWQLVIMNEVAFPVTALPDGPKAIHRARMSSYLGSRL